MRIGERGMQRQVDGREQVAQLVGDAGVEAAISSGDSSVRWAGMTPQAPWTKTCMRNAPTVIVASVGA